MLVFMLAVMLPAAALIVASAAYLRHIQRGKMIEAAYRLDYQHQLQIAEERIIAQRGVPVIGIEPNAEMRPQASAHPVEEGCPTPRYQDGRGEATGLPDACADAILSAQAFHWCQAEPARAPERRPGE